MTQTASGDEWTRMETDLKDNGVLGDPNLNVSGPRL